MLTESEVAFFKSQGYVVVPGLFDAQRVTELRELVAEHQKRAAASETRGKLDLMETKPDGTPQAIFRLSRIMARDPAFQGVATDPRIAAIARDLLGPDAAVCINRHNMMMAKAPRVERQVDWHQDAATWGHDELISLIVFLGDAGTSNGCLEVIPGLHRQGLLKTVDKNGFIVMDVDDPQIAALTRQALPVVAHAGDAFFFHALLPHFSKANTSESSRPTLTFAYVSEARKALKFQTGSAPIEALALSA